MDTDDHTDHHHHHDNDNSSDGIEPPQARRSHRRVSFCGSLGKKLGGGVSRRASDCTGMTAASPDSEYSSSARSSSRDGSYHHHEEDEDSVISDMDSGVEQGEEEEEDCDIDEPFMTTTPPPPQQQQHYVTPVSPEVTETQSTAAVLDNPRAAARLLAELAFLGNDNNRTPVASCSATTQSASSSVIKSSGTGDHHHPVTATSSHHEDVNRNNNSRAAMMQRMIMMQQQENAMVECESSDEAEEEDDSSEEDSSYEDEDEYSSSDDTSIHPGEHVILQEQQQQQQQQFVQQIMMRKRAQQAQPQQQQHQQPSDRTAAMMQMMMMSTMPQAPHQSEEDAPTPTSNSDDANSRTTAAGTVPSETGVASPAVASAPSSNHHHHNSSRAAAMMQMIAMQQQNQERDHSDDDEEESSEEDSSEYEEDEDTTNSGHSELVAELPMASSQQQQLVQGTMEGKRQQRQPASPEKAPMDKPKPLPMVTTDSSHKAMTHKEDVSGEEGVSESEESREETSDYRALMADLPIDARRQSRSQGAATLPKSRPSMEDDASDGGFSVEGGGEDEDLEDASSGEEDDSSEDDSSYDDEMDTHASGSYDSSEDWSSSTGSDYSDIMDEMVRGRQPGASPPVQRPGLSREPSQRFNSSFRERLPVTSSKGLPGMSALPTTTSSSDIPCEDPPMEGLAMLKNIRSELEKVGQLIVKNKEGEKFLQRAQILTSINYLASNVPRCVLEDLGQEIRDQLKKQEERKNRTKKSKDVMASLVSFPDDGSQASEVSRLDLDEQSCPSADTDGDMMEDDLFPEARTPETLSKKFTMENFVPKTNRQSIRDSRALGVGLSSHTSGHIFEPKLREESCPARERASRTYSFLSASSTSSESTDEYDEPNLPIVTYFECALLFVDISGFTKLSTRLDPENLSKVINTYFEVLVSHVSDFNGDIQKFAGDALFAEFRATPDCPLSKCAELAAACATALVRDCADFPVSTVCGLMDTDDGIPATLNVHCGLGIGEMAGLHIGDNENRREYMYLGNPIKQTAHACEFAKLGEAAASREFCEILKEMCIFEADFASDASAYVIAERAHSLLNCNENELLASQRRNARSRGITEHVDGLEPESLKEYRRLMSLYAHPVALSNDIAAENDFSPTGRKIDNDSRDRQMEEAELRSVYVMFVNPIVAVEMSGDAKKDTASVEIVHDIMKIANRELRRYNGHMRQFVMDDKGMVLIATFGLRGSTFPNMVGERALPATIALHNALQFEMGIECKIGATFGDAYCGAVGGEKRNEYAVMGPSVNLAARLMSNESNPGILVDGAIRKMASQSFAFNALDPIIAKGYKDRVSIFEPLSPVERGWGRMIPNFVGREEEMSKITQIASSYSRHKKENNRPQMVLIKSATGMGKSTLLAHSIDRIRKHFVARRSKIGIAKHVAREAESLKPFFAAAQLLRKMLIHYHGCFDDIKSIASGSCGSSIMGCSAGTASVSFGGDTTVLSISQFTDRLEAVFIEVGASTACLEYVKAILFEDDIKQEELIPELDSAAVTMLAAAFRRCNNSLKLGVLAIDDAHQCDEASWLVFQQVFETAENILLMGTTSASSLTDIKISRDFITDLEEAYKKAGRFHAFTLDNLTRDEVSHMIMKSMALQKQNVTDEMLDSVYNQSLGMPLVANDLVTELKDQLRNGSQLIASGNTESIADIFLHKIDGFDVKIRDTLNVCAILGHNCGFEDIFSIIAEMSDAKEDELRQECEGSVEFLLKEGILAEHTEDSVKEYVFTHDLWRSIPLNLMLGSRKRDIHRKIAQNLEGKVSGLAESDIPVDMQRKIFEHWNATGDTAKSANASLVLRHLLEREDNFPECIQVLEEVLALWGWQSGANDSRLAGLSKNFLNHVSADELSNIITMLVALGRAYTKSSRPTEGVVWWENALRVMSSTKSAPLIRDRSIIFSAFNGLSKAIQDGHLVQDVFCRYEQSMIRKYIQETRAHGRLIHHVHALFLQMKLYGRQGDLDKAIAVHSIIKSIYKPEKHSEKLRNVYGQDSGTLSFALCAFWETVEGEKKSGLKMCRNVLKDLLPRFDRDFANMFDLMYPLVLAFKEAGYPAEGKAFFEKLIVVPYGDCPEHHELHSLVQVFPAVSILCAAAANSKRVSQSNVTTWAHWALEQRSFGKKLQIQLGRFARCADSLIAEVCLLLAQQLPSHDPLRPRVIKKGSDLITEALNFHRKFGMKAAIKPAKYIQAKLRIASKSK